MRTPPGYYSTKGATEPSACGGPSLYCPGGKGAPSTVTKGHETFTDPKLDGAPTDLDDATTRTSERPCRDGIKCVVGLAVECRIGSYCIAGNESLCPAGYVGSEVSQTTSNCSGPCPIGSYCKEGSTAPVTCPPGTYGERAGLKKEDECSPCPMGAYCTEGEKKECETGFYNDQEKSESQSACIRCNAAESTTVSKGAQSEAECICKEDHFAVPTQDSTSGALISC